MTDISAQFSDLALSEIIAICELQEHLFSLTLQTMKEKIQYFLRSIFVDTELRMRQFIDNLFVAIKTKPSSIPLHADFLNELISLASKENQLSLISSIVLNPFPSMRNPAFSRLAFLGECIKFHVVSEKDIVNSIRNYFRTYSPTLLPWKYAFVWFAPTIQKVDQTLYNDMLFILLQQMKEEKLSQELKSFIEKLEVFQANEWELHSQTTTLMYTPGTIAAILKEDRVSELKALADKEDGFDVNQRIVADVFEKNVFLRFSPTLLQFASFHGAAKCVTELLTRKADVKLRDNANKSTVMFAIAGGNIDVIQIYEIMNLDFTATPQIAALFLKQDIFKRLMSTERFDLNVVDHDFASVLHQAAASNNIQILLYCIEHGVDVNIKDNRNWTPLHYASANGQSDATFLLASHKSVEVNAKTNDGCTALILAAKYGFANPVIALLSREDILVNELDSNHFTALHYAAASNYIDVVKALLSAKTIKADIEDANQCTASDLASSAGFFNCAQIIRDNSQGNCSIY